MWPSSLRFPGSLVALLTAAIAASVSAQASDPFARGARWARAPLAEEAWLPRSVTFVGEQLIWAGSGGADANLALLAHASSNPGGTLLFEDRGGLGDVVGSPLVAAGPEASQLFALAQARVAGDSARRTFLRRYDALAAAQGESFAPLWERELPQRTTGPALLATDAGGDTLVAALLDPSHGRIALDWVDPLGGATLRHLTFPGRALTGLLLSADGKRIVLGAGDRVFWLRSDGSPLFERALSASTSALGLSGDGGWLVFGELGSLELWREASNGVEMAGRWAGAGGELATRVAVARGGTSLLVAWWDSSDGAGVKLERIDTVGGGRRVLHQQGARVGRPQNFPSALLLSEDGTRVALGLWGQADERPEALLLPLDGSEPLLSLDLPGSVDALALDPIGAGLMVARRDGHAGQFSRQGELGLFETGERDLVLRSAPRLGRSLEFSLRVAPDAVSALFGVALLRGSPLVLRWGALWLRQAGPGRLFPGVSVGPGRMNASLFLPVDGSLIGLPLGVQALSLGPAGGRLSAPIRLAIL